MTISVNISKLAKGSRRIHSETHLFVKGQTVRLRNVMQSTGKLYLITASLPPSGTSQQYRIRNDGEAFERMAMESDLELVSSSLRGQGHASVEALFGSPEAT